VQLLDSRVEQVSDVIVSLYGKMVNVFFAVESVILRKDLYVW
jgi:hypothetical protein